MAQTYGMAIIPWSPLGGGLLTGKYQRGQEPPEGARFADQTNPLYRRRLNDRIYDVVEGLQPIADAKGCTLSQLALAWVQQQPGVTSPIIGPRTMEQFEDNMGASTSRSRTTTASRSTASSAAATASRRSTRRTSARTSTV